MTKTANLFVEKYAPTTLDDVVLDEGIKSILKSYLTQNNLPNLILAGHQGIGKTTIARILANSVSANRYLFISASMENGVDVIRVRVKEYAEMMAEPGTLKVVVLDEADTLSNNTGGSSAQEALRNIIDPIAYPDTRFILTCNRPERLIGPLQSRCTPIHLKFSEKDILARLVTILEKEKTQWSKETLTEFFNSIVIQFFPDIRAILGYLQHCTLDGVLKPSLGVTANTDLKKLAEDLVKMALGNTSPVAIRKTILDSTEIFNNNYEILGKAIFNFVLDKSDGTKNPELARALLQILGEMMYRMSIVVDKEIQLYAALLQCQDATKKCNS